MQDDSPPSGGSGEGQRWLPPEPAGPRPRTGGGELEDAPPSGPPVGQPPPARPQPPQAPPPSAPPAYPGAQQERAANQPPAPYALTGSPPRAWGDPEGPGNGAAVAALVLGIVSLAMVLLGIFALPLLIALPCGIVAIVLGRSGMQRVDRGETTKHRGLAKGGFVTGIIGTTLAVLGIIGFVLLVLFSEEFSREFEESFDEQLDQGLEQSSLGTLALRLTPSVLRFLAG